MNCLMLLPKSLNINHVVFENLRFELVLGRPAENFCHFAKGLSINDVSSEGEGGGPPQKPMKGDENRYLILGKADVVYDLPKNLQNPMKICTLF